MCSLYGLIDVHGSLPARVKKKILRELGTACECRGTDATGIAYNSGGRLRIYKKPVPAHQLRLRIPDDARVIMGHTRMTTQGCASYIPNDHPFPGHTRAGDFALAHNGVIWNDKLLRARWNLPRTQIETDSYIGVQLIEQQKALDFSSLRYMAEQVEGSFTFTVLDSHNKLYFIKGDNPLCIYHWPGLGVYLYASTEEILRQTLRRLPIPDHGFQAIKPDCGEILSIDAKGKLTQSSFNAENLLMDYCCSPWWYSQRKATAPKKSADTTYLDDLKMVASAFGYDSRAIDRLVAMGFAPEEIEEFLYDGEL